MDALDVYSASSDRYHHATTTRIKDGNVKVRSRLLALACAVTAFVAPAIIEAPAAQAASVGYIYISFPKWLANCPNGGSVTGIWAADSLQTWNADWGDDLIYGKVFLNQWNSVQYTLYCQNGWASYYQPGYSTNFYPTRNNQTVWVGPGGWTRN